MSDRLKMAFAEAEKLSEADQDAFASFLLVELEDERRWSDQFAATGDILVKLAAESRTERDAGNTRPLDDLLK